MSMLLVGTSGAFCIGTADEFSVGTNTSYGGVLETTDFGCVVGERSVGAVILMVGDSEPDVDCGVSTKAILAGLFCFSV